MFKQMDSTEVTLDEELHTNPVVSDTEPIVTQRVMSDDHIVGQSKLSLSKAQKAEI